MFRPWLPSAPDSVGEAEQLEAGGAATGFNPSPDQWSGLLAGPSLAIEIPESQFLDPMDAVRHEWVATIMAGTPEAMALFSERHPALNGDGSSLLLAVCAEPEGGSWTGGGTLEQGDAGGMLIACTEPLAEFYRFAGGDPPDLASGLAQAQAINTGWMFGG
jgi:hypothetical protein